MKNPSKALTRKAAINMVTEALSRHATGKFKGKLKVNHDSVRKDMDNWWWVVVNPVGNGRDLYDYYDVLAKVMAEIHDEKGYDIQLVPLHPPSGD